jgi:hypothetical protein
MQFIQCLIEGKQTPFPLLCSGQDEDPEIRKLKKAYMKAIWLSPA